MNKIDDCIVSIWKEPDWTSNDIIKYIKPFISPTKLFKTDIISESLL